MKFRWIMIAVAVFVVGLSGVATDPALARSKSKARSHCIDRPQHFSWGGWLFNPAPQPNGCSPAVYQYGKFVGQDPDPSIRAQMSRDPMTGYNPY